MLILTIIGLCAAIYIGLKQLEISKEQIKLSNQQGYIIDRQTKLQEALIYTTKATAKTFGLYMFVDKGKEDLENEVQSYYDKVDELLK